MTEVVSFSEMQIGYEKFLQLRERQKQANTKYRSTAKGREKTNQMHRNWVATKVGDVEYKLHTNTMARERYYIRKAQKLALKETLLEKKPDTLDILGETLEVSEMAQNELLP
jgi:hypothetical protein